MTDQNLPTPCRGNDPYCPCQDGDACHYVDLPGSPAMLPKVIPLNRPQAWAVKFDAARNEFLAAWRDAITHMSPALAEAEAAATHSAMVDAAREVVDHG